MKKSATTKTAFSPPYGDGTFYVDEVLPGDTFSPPYGDGTKFLSEEYRGD